MQIKSFELGPQRWHIELWPKNEKEGREFYQWMQENIHHCFRKRRYDTIHTDRRYYWEVRGSDKTEHTTIMLRWL